MDNNNIKKTFGLTEFAINNSTIVWIGVLLITIFGIITYKTTSVESFPEIKIPQVMVNVVYGGNSPKDIENLVIRHIEKELKSVDKVVKINSSSRQDFGSIIVEFESDIELEEAVRKTKDAVDKSKPNLPDDLREPPSVLELDFSAVPIFNINLSGNYTPKELKFYAEYLEDEIEKLKEISKVNIRGLDEQELRILVDPKLMDERKVTYSDIENSISSENLTMSGGSLLLGEQKRVINISGEIENPKEIDNFIVKNEGGNPVFLKDVGYAEFSYKERDSYARLNGKNVVTLDVIKRSGQNLINSADKIFEIINDAKKSKLPNDLNIYISNDQSVDTKKMVRDLENSIFLGVILVVLVLLFFIGTNNSLFVGIAIPMSMLITIIFIPLLGYTINMMVLFGLIMALGMLVDNGIVIVENIHRRFAEGESILNATRYGVGEVAIPIISSTLTTLAAFFPLMVWPGTVGGFMKILPTILTISLSASVFVALVINPVLTTMFMKLDVSRKKATKKIIIRYIILFTIGVVTIFLYPNFSLFNIALTLIGLDLIDRYFLSKASLNFMNIQLPKLENFYRKVLTYALRNSGKVIFSTFGLFIFSILLFIIFPPKVTFFPENEPKQIMVFVELPLGTDVEITNKYLINLEEYINEIVNPYKKIIKSITTNVSKETNNNNDIVVSSVNVNPNKAKITIDFVDFVDRGGISTNSIMKLLSEKLKKEPGILIKIDKNRDGPPTGAPISLQVSGDNFEKIINITEDIKKTILESGIRGIEDLTSDLNLGKPELTIKIDRDFAKKYGLTTYTIANEIRTSLFGKEISKYKLGNDDYEINIRLNDQYRQDLTAILNKFITFRDPSNGKLVQVPISSVAKFNLTSTYEVIKRENLKRVANLTSNVLPGFNATEITSKIRKLLVNYKIPEGYEIKISGEQEKQSDEMNFLKNALMIAIALIFFIIVAQFNSVLIPFLIMFSIIFSTIGVFLGISIMRDDFVIIMTMIGIISLAGVVVNNAIVLLDFAELRVKEKKLQLNRKLTLEEYKYIIIMTGALRLRPVLLTAITTVLGLIPLAIGFNFDFITLYSEYDPQIFIGGDNNLFWGPMSWTIIYGLTFSTILTLVVLPSMYYISIKLLKRYGFE